MNHILPMPDGVKWNQRKTPACVGFACTLAQMIKLYGLTRKWIPLSPYSVYGYYKTNGGGLTLHYGLDALRDFGAIPAYEWDEPCANPECAMRLKLYRKSNPEADASAARFRLRQYREVRDIDDVRAEIDAGNPIVMALDVDGSFGKRDKGIEPRILSSSKTYSHAVCIVGYTDDNYMIARNSHGESCNGGFVLIPKGRPFDAAYALCDVGTSILLKAKTIKLTIGSKTADVDGKPVDMPAAPYIRRDRLLVPVRAIADALGCTVTWDAASGTATLTSEEGVLALTTHSPVLQVNGKPVGMDAAPEIVGSGTMMIPVRYIAEALHCKVAWDAPARTATITAI